MSATQKMPGFTRRDAQGPQVQMAPQILQHDGETFMVVHAEGLTTGVAVTPGQNVDEGRLMLPLWHTPPFSAGMGIALTFTPDDAMIDMIVGSLTTFRDRQRAHAASQAEAAIAKARGK